MSRRAMMARCGSARRPCIVTAVIAVGALFLPGGADGQQPPPQPRAVIVGRVTDTLGTPLPECFVRLEGARAATLCDSVGRFRLPGLGHELTTFEVKRLGYVPGRFSVMVLGDSMQVNIQLVPIALELPPITVTAEGLNPYLVERGFYRRMQEGETALFITPEELERLRPQRVTAVLRDRPGISIIWVDEGGGELVPLLSGRNYCLLNVFVDGVEIVGIYQRSQGIRGGVSTFSQVGQPGAPPPGGSSSVGQDLSLDAFILPHTIAAIEIYPSGPDTPIEFRTANQCGAIVIWTKVGTHSAPADGARIQVSPADTAPGSPARTRS